MPVPATGPFERTTVIPVTYDATPVEEEIFPLNRTGSSVFHAEPLSNATAMTDHSPLLIEVWKETCQHLELAEAVLRLFPLLGARLPLARLAVRELELGRHTVETLAAAPSEGDDPSRDELGADELDAVLAWCRSGALEHGAASVLRRKLPGLVPEGVEGDVLLGALPSREEPRGVLLLAARRGQRFDAAHEAVARALLEPFAAALENDRRVRALSSVREAAEAERSALLSRLGRTEIGDTIVGAGAGLHARDGARRAGREPRRAGARCSARPARARRWWRARSTPARAARRARSCA